MGRLSPASGSRRRYFELRLLIDRLFVKLLAGQGNGWHVDAIKDGAWILV
jgi:hypothetical protein